MKCKKTASFVAVVFIGLLGIAIFTSVRLKSSKPEFSLSSYRRITLATGEEFANTAELDKILAGLPKSRRLIWGHPDRVLILYSSSSSVPRFLSIFLKEGFVYEGNHLDAWTERMEDKKSLVYLLNANKRSEIEALLQKSL